MIAGAEMSPEAQVAGPVVQIDALPDAPLAMPKQRLDGLAPPGGGVRAALQRLLFARPGRSEG